MIMQDIHNHRLRLNGARTDNAVSAGCGAWEEQAAPRAGRIVSSRWKVFHAAIVPIRRLAIE
jgi:hypothetical protein